MNGEERGKKEEQERKVKRERERERVKCVLTWVVRNNNKNI